MTRQVVALMTGLPRNGDLLQASVKPLLALKRDGVIHRILYVTWNRSDLDAALAPVVAMPEIELLRVPEPAVPAAKSPELAKWHHSFICQTHSIAIGLAHIGDPDALVLRLRPDFVIDTAFLASKLLAFNYLCAPSDLPGRFPVQLPPSPFTARIWVPWADSNQPFFMEDGAFLGLCRDVVKLATPDVEREILRHEDLSCMWILHVLRYIHPFLKDYPIFQGYLREFHLFHQTQDFRQKMLPLALANPFFLHMLFANAWILATSFHVDCGHAGDIKFYPAKYVGNFRADNLDELPQYPPYDKVEAWRNGQSPGSLLISVLRPFGRLVDDCWQSALFRRAQLADVTSENRLNALNNLSLYHTGLLAEPEAAFYATLRQIEEQHWNGRTA